MTPQEAYDGIRAWFTRPGAVRAVDGGVCGGVCAYRGDRDPASPRRCAAGCLLPDELYRPTMEMQPVDELPVFKKFLGPAFDFVREAQGRHDCAYTVEGFIERLDALAGEYGLKVPRRHEPPYEELCGG